MNDMATLLQRRFKSRNIHKTYLYIYIFFQDMSWCFLGFADEDYNLALGLNGFSSFEGEKSLI